MFASQSQRLETMDAPVDAAEWVCEVVRLAQSGEGIALWDGRALFIPGAFPKERVLAKKTAHPQRAELLKILEASPERRPPPCPHHNKCGGCDWMAVGEEAQRAFKQSLMVSTLERMGGIVEGSYTCCPMAFNQNVLGYRRRARLGRAGRRLGFRMRSSAVCTAIEFCPILVPALQHLPGAFCEAWGEEAMGEIEEVELLEGQGEIALGIWLNSKLQDKHLKLAQRARERLKAAGIWLQGRGGLAKEEGRAYLRDWGFAYMHPAVFAQSNGPMNTQLLRTLIAWMQTLVADIAKAAVLELFSGNGNFTWAISRLVRELWAIETSNLAIHLAQRMGVEKARTLQSLAPSSQPQPHNASMRFIVGDVAQVVKGLIKEAKRFDCIVLDPPRQGAAGIGGWAKQLGAQYVFYISCNPSSLARDAKELQREGFSPIRLQLFDFFPQTHHAESLMAFIKTQKP